MTATAEVTAPIRINRIYHEQYDVRTRYNVIYGSRRSGKSVGVSQLLVRRAIEYGPRKIVAMRKVARTLRLSVWPRLKKAVDESIGLRNCGWNKTEMTITLPNGSEFICVGADDPEKLKSLEDVTDIWMEETTEFDEGDMNTVDAGMSATVDFLCQIWLTFNPVPRVPGAQHWIEKRFLSVEHKLGVPVVNDNTLVLRTWYKQNAFCPQEVIDVLEGYKTTNPSLYRMWALGEFTTLEGAILSDIDVIKRVPEWAEFVGYGLDFGYANDPAALVAIWVRNDDLYLREEMYSPGMTNQAIASYMRELGVDRSAIIRGDAAEPKSIAEICEEGFTAISGWKGPDYKRAAARWLQSKHLHVVEGSTNLLRELSTWSWSTDKHGNILPKPADGDDHTVDATIYGIYNGKRWDWGVA